MNTLTIFSHSGYATRTNTLIIFNSVALCAFARSRLDFYPSGVRALAPTAPLYPALGFRGTVAIPGRHLYKRVRVRS